MRYNQWTATLAICFVFCFGLSPQPSIAEIDRHLGTGRDGDLIITYGSTLNTSKSSVISDNPSGANYIYVSAPDQFSVGDEILIISMIDPQDNNSQNVAGQYETKIIIEKLGQRLTLNRALENTYNTSNKEVHQAIAVPHYQNVSLSGDASLSADPWDGTTGGVLFFRATGTVDIGFGRMIFMNGKGYRGNYGMQNNSRPGFQGEGYMGGYHTSWDWSDNIALTGDGSITSYSATSSNGNGGGGRPASYNSGGGAGGGHETKGEKSGSNEGVNSSITHSPVVGRQTGN